MASYDVATNVYQALGSGNGEGDPFGLEAGAYTLPLLSST